MAAIPSEDSYCARMQYLSRVKTSIGNIWPPVQSNVLFLHPEQPWPQNYGHQLTYKICSLLHKENTGKEVARETAK